MTLLVKTSIRLNTLKHSKLLQKLRAVLSNLLEFALNHCAPLVAPLQLALRRRKSAINPNNFSNAGSTPTPWNPPVSDQNLFQTKISD